MCDVCTHDAHRIESSQLEFRQWIATKKKMIYTNVKLQCFRRTQCVLRVYFNYFYRFENCTDKLFSSSIHTHWHIDTHAHLVHWLMLTCLFEKLQHFAFLMRPQMKFVQQPPWMNCFCFFFLIVWSCTSSSPSCVRARVCFLCQYNLHSKQTQRNFTLTFSTLFLFFYFLLCFFLLFFFFC